jgi:hypothetical protein
MSVSGPGNIIQIYKNKIQEKNNEIDETETARFRPRNARRQFGIRVAQLRLFV